MAMYKSIIKLIMKSFCFLLICIFCCAHIIFGQMNTTGTAWKYGQKADSLYNIFKYNSASVYYYKAAALFEKQLNWLPCVKNYRLAGNALLQAAKYDTALYYSQKALTIAETCFREKNKDEMFEKSDVLLNMANINENKEKYDDELIDCNKAMELVLKTDSSAKLRIANTWNKTGDAYRELSKYDSAQYFCQKALAVKKEFLGDDHIDLADSYFSLGQIYFFNNEYDKAFENFQKALHIRVSNYGEQHPDVAICYSCIGVIFYIKGDYDKAMEYYQKTLKIQISDLGENHPDLALTYLNIGRYYYNKGEINEALEYFNKTLQINLSIYGEMNSRVSKSYNYIGMMYYNKGEFDKALKFYQKALQIWVDVLGLKNTQVATYYNNIGNAYHEKGECDKALEFYKRALYIWSSTYGENHTNVAGTYNNIGIIFDDKGEYDKALEYCKKALQTWISVYGENHPKTAACYNNIGEIYDDKGEFDKALVFLDKALQSRISVCGENHPDVAESYNNIGAVYKNKGEFDKAIKFYQKALSINISVYGENHPGVAENYNNIAETYFKKGETCKALQFYQKALISNVVGFTDTFVYKNPTLTKILSQSGLVKTLTGKANIFYQISKNKTNSNRDLKAALSMYGLAFQLINKMRNEYNIENTKLLLSETTKKYYSGALHVALEMDRINPSQENSIRPFEFMEKGKSATMTARFNEYNAQHFAGIPDSLLENEKGLRTRIGFLTTQIENLKYQKNSYDTLKINALENENFTCSRKLDSLITHFETDYPAYYEFKYANKTVSVPEIQKSLDDNTAILNYFVGDSSLFIATITDSLYEMKEITIDSSFKKLVINYYKDIKTAETKSFVTNSQHIYEKLIKPVERYISKKGHLIVIPDDYLYYVPFETLINNDASSKIQNEDYSKLDFFIKSHSISYHHSATLWYNSKKRENELASKRKLNFIGFAPVFSKANGVILSSNIGAIDTTGDNLAYRSISRDLKSFNPLPYSKDEVTSIVRLFEKRRKDAKAYLYSEASEANFKNNISSYSFIHISSHGFSNDKEPDLSGIVFSQPSDTTGKEDGILYAGETYNLNLNADLIVLSSCESGLGKLVKGEGLQAMSRGFLYSGTPNVIFSLWKALDKPTKDLMVQFYSNVLDGKTYAESLRLAKLKLINNHETAFPHFWGLFVLIGR